MDDSEQSIERLKQWAKTPKKKEKINKLYIIGILAVLLIVVVIYYLKRSASNSNANGQKLRERPLVSMQDVEQDD
jgi:hypothetical protein